MIERRGLYAVTDERCADVNVLLSAVESALRGGAVMLQYRDKRRDQARRHEIAAALRTVCRRHGAAFIINDDVELAHVVDADGVHLGEHDMALATARSRLGPQAIIGVSCYNRLEFARAAAQAGADYIAFGSFFVSPTKPEAVRADLALLRRAHRELPLPIAAIGGITPENGAELVAAGADLLAVVSGIFAQTDVGAAAARYAKLFENMGREKVKSKGQRAKGMSQ